MVPTQFVNLIRIHLREACILICSQLLVKTNMLGVLDLVLIYTVGTLSIWSMITFVYLFVVLLVLLILCLLLFLGHDVARLQLFLLLLFLLVYHGLGIIHGHAGCARELEFAFQLRGVNFALGCCDQELVG